MDAETDVRLMQRCREGDDDAFAVIVDRYKHALVNYLTHLTRSRERAEEVAQDAFVRLYRSVANDGENERLGPYLFRIATNLVVSQARRERRWTMLLPRLRASSRPIESLPDTNLLATEIQRNVAAALDRLPLKYRAPLVLFEIEEWSYDEIGNALSLRIGTVKSRISRARQMLRRHLAPWWIGEKSDERERERRPAEPAAAREGIARIHL